jgi:hypothetical protein
MIGIGIGLPFIKAGGNSAEALAWKARIEANGGTISQALLDIFDTNFFIPAKANGNILTELDRLNIYCGLVGFEIAARTNLIKSDHYVTPVSSPTFDVNGYRSSGTSYLNLNYNPSTQAVKFSRDSAFFFTIIKNPNFSTTFRVMGGFNAAGTTGNEIQRQANPRIQVRTNSTLLTSNVNVSTIGNNFLAGLRTISTQQESIFNSNIQSGLATSDALANCGTFELTSCLGASTPLGNYDTSPHMASGHGSAATDGAALRTILNNLFTALGV